MRNFADKLVKKIKTHFIFNNYIFFPRNSSNLYDNVEEYGTAGQATGDNAILRMRIARCITKTPNLHSEYVIFFSTAIIVTRTRFDVTMYFALSCTPPLSNYVFPFYVSACCKMACCVLLFFVIVTAASRGVPYAILNHFLPRYKGISLKEDKKSRLLIIYIKAHSTEISKYRDFS